VVAPDVAVLARQTAEDLGDEEGLGPFDALAEQVLTSLAARVSEEQPLVGAAAAIALSRIEVSLVPVSEFQEQDCQSLNAPSRSWDRLARGGRAAELGADAVTGNQRSSEPVSWVLDSDDK
jgi:hypothetical protein